MSVESPSPRPISPELVQRIVSALVLAPIALGGAWLGGVPWLVGATGVALLLYWEWNKLTRDGRWDPSAIAGLGVVLGAALAIALGWRGLALMLFAAAVVAGAVMVRFDRSLGWAARGTAYTLAFLVPVVLLRDSGHGFVAILFLFAVVWATDVSAFFAGRAIGGPKLWPAISPKKTWAGFIGGSLAGGAAAFLLMMVFGIADEWQLLLIAFVLSVVAHGGDLFESWVKRLFHQKDSGHLIPGHGGFMDRLDGFIFAGTVALLIGLARGGPWHAGEGLILW